MSFWGRVLRIPIAGDTFSIAIEVSGTGYTRTLTASATSGEIASVVWSVDGSPIGTSNPLVDYAFPLLPTSQEYTVSVTATSTTGQVASASVSATVDAATIEDMILALPGIVAYLPLNETSGTIAVNATGNTALNGTYAGSIPLNSVPFPSGGGAPNYADADDNITFSVSAVNSVFDWDTGWVILWYQMNPVALNKILFRVNADSLVYVLDIYAHGNAIGNRGSVIMSSPYIVLNFYQRHDEWTMLAATWENGGKFISYLQGTQCESANYIAPTPTTLSSFALGRILGYRGAIAHFAIGAGDLPSPTQIDNIYKAVYPTITKGLFVCGDSYATDNDYWIDTLVASLRTETGDAWREAPYRIGLSGQRVAALHTYLDANLGAITTTAPDTVLVVIAANDITGGTTEAPFKADLAGVIDALRAKWPDAEIYVHFPYRDDLYNGAYDAFSLTVRGWMQDVIALYPSNVHAGPDGNVWFKTNIDTWSSDRIHPNTDAGRVEFASVWMTALGY